MALSPKKLNEWTKDDQDAVEAMEIWVDSVLQSKQAEFKNGEYRIPIGLPSMKTLFQENAPKRLSVLMQRYENAGWGEVGGGILGDGSAVLTLRECKRYYPNPF